MEIKAEITINPNLKLVYESDKIIECNTHTFVISNPNLPEYNAYPNSGYLKIKDDDLSIYNYAINGVFDDFQYTVDFYINDERIAHHIINERPEYDYENKTVSFNLGNIIDSADTQPFDEYKYPLMSQNLADIFVQLMMKMYGFTSENAVAILNDKYDVNQTFADVFSKINIEYPYLSRKTNRQVLQNVLAVAQCGMYVNKANEFILLNLSGKYFDKKDTAELANVTYIPPQEINKPFLPSIILSNKYNKINVEHKDVVVENHYNEVISDFVNPVDNFGVSIDLSGVFQGNYNSEGAKLGIFAQQSVKKYSESEFSKDINIYSKGNLSKIWKISDLYNDKNQVINPQYKLNVITKITNTHKGKIISVFNDGSGGQRKEINKLYEDGTNNIRQYEIKYITSESQITGYGVYFLANAEPPISKTEKLYDNTDLRVDKNTFKYGNIQIDLMTQFNHTYNSNVLKANDSYTIGISNVLSRKYTYFFYGNGDRKFNTVLGGTGYWTIENIDAKCDIIFYKAEEIDVTIYGNYSLITFNDKTYTIDNSNGKLVNEFTLTSANNELMQTDNARAVATKINDVFATGVHTGELTVIPHNGRLYQIGDIVTPCKDYNNTPILNVYYQVVDIETTYDNGAVFQKLILREVK